MSRIISISAVSVISAASNWTASAICSSLSAPVASGCTGSIARSRARIIRATAWLPAPRWSASMKCSFGGAGLRARSSVCAWDCGVRSGLSLTSSRASPPYERASTPSAGADADHVVEALEVGLEPETAVLAVFLRHGADEVAHGDRPVRVGGLERGRQRAVADRAARELELLTQEVEVDVVGQRSLGREHLLPDAAAVLGLREREVDHEVEAADERVVDVAAKVRG